jgi:hypothetical protein
MPSSARWAKRVRGTNTLNGLAIRRNHTHARPPSACTTPCRKPSASPPHPSLRTSKPPSGGSQWTPWHTPRTKPAVAETRTAEARTALSAREAKASGDVEGMGTSQTRSRKAAKPNRPAAAWAAWQRPLSSISPRGQGCPRSGATRIWRDRFLSEPGSPAAWDWAGACRARCRCNWPRRTFPAALARSSR